MKTCETLTKPDKEQWALALPGGKSEGTIVVIDKFIYSNGGTITSEDGKTCTMNSPEVIEALEQYQSLEKICASRVWLPLCVKITWRCSKIRKSPCSGSRNWDKTAWAM